MMFSLLRMFGPAGIIGVVFALLWWAVQMGYIPDAVAFWLWPGLIALAFLGYAIYAWLKDQRIWVYPLATGFVVQTAGFFLLMARVFESRWEPLAYTLVAVGVVLLFMGLQWLVRLIRAKSLERRMAQGLAEGTPGNEQELGRIRKDMLGALRTLRVAGQGRNAIYELPWFLVMGRPAAGKTVAIKNSGLGLPVKKDWVKGVGGTYTCDWFFTNELIFLDTPGKWVTEGADEGAQKQWKQLLRLLKKYRGRRPLDGLVVVVPADDLLSRDEAELEEQAANVRDVVDRIHDELDFRFPVYLLVTKCDLVDGFVDFFRGLPPQRRHEILGWSNENPNRRGAPKLIRKGFRCVHRRLEEYRLEMLGQIARRTQARRLLFFTEDFKSLEDPLAFFAEVFFQSDRYHEPPVFRGFYFSSGTQGDGVPMSGAVSTLARSLNVTAASAPEEREDKKRSYFLLDLFRELMVGDDGLVGRSTGHWWKQRRYTMLGYFAPAGLALLLLVTALVSFLWNRSIYYAAAERVPQIVEELDRLPGDLPPNEVAPTLALTGEIRTYHRKLSQFSPLRSMGMRRPGRLDDDVLAIFRDQFSRRILEPTLYAAEQVATDASRACTDRIDVLQSVVWLRMGRRAQWSGDLDAFDEVWSLPHEKAETARKELLRQYAYYKNHQVDDSGGNLLPRFSIRLAAQSITDDCADQGATSSLEMYRLFQEQCSNATTNADIEDCAARLSQVLRYEESDFRLFIRKFDTLKEDLSAIELEEPEARRGLELLSTVDLVQGTSSECLTRFSETVMPEIRRYSEQDEMLEDCRLQVESASSRGERFKVRNEVLQAQQEALTAQEEDLDLLMRDYSLSCRGDIPGFRRLDINVLRSVTTSDRRVRCLPIERADRAPARTAARAPAPRPKAPARRPVRKTELLSAGKRVAQKYEPAAWHDRQREWSGLLEAAQVGYDDAQRKHQVDLIRKEVAKYAGAYSNQWIDYLDALRLDDRKPPVDEWLRQLGSTTEYATLIRPAAEAAAVAAQGADPPFDAMAERLRPLDGLDDFVDTGLAEYQALLGQVADDIERCQLDGRFFLDYKKSVGADDRNNSLVQAQNWVSRRAGPTVASNKLRPLLSKPLQEAETFVRSNNLLRTQWQDLQKLYDEAISGHSPFEVGGEPIDADSLRALLGGATGVVTRVRAAAGDGTMSPRAKAWLDRAEALSRALFEPGSDDMRPIRVRVTIGDATYDPPNTDKNVRIEQVRVYFDEGADFLWKAGEDPVKQLELTLFGDDASEYSYIRATPGQRKGLVGRAVGGNWKLGESVEVTSEGFLAPLMLMRIGAGSGVQPSADSVALQYPLQIELKKGKVATANLSIKLASSEAAALIHLMDAGLDAPPRSLN